MTDESTKNQSDVADIAKALSAGRLSRRNFFDRLKGLGVGLGAAFLLGAGARAATTPDAGVAVKSTNPALDAIIKDAPQSPESDPAATQGAPLQQTAYVRGYRRSYVRAYRRI